MVQMGRGKGKGEGEDEERMHLLEMLRDCSWPERKVVD